VTRVVVVVDGGVVQAIVADDESVRVIVKDYDVEGSDQQAPEMATDANGERFYAIAGPIDVDAAACDDTFTRCGIEAASEPPANRISAALNYCADLDDSQLTEDSAAIVIEDRDRLLEALRTIVHKASTRPVHVDSCDRPCALVLNAALDAAREVLQGR